MTVLANYGLLADAVICGALIACLPLGRWRRPAGLLAAALALASGLAMAAYGTFSTPSVTLLQLALLALLTPRPTPLSFRPALVLLLIAAAFYPLALGWTSFDPYALGYQPRFLLLALIPLAAVIYWLRADRWLLILAIDLAAYASGVFANLWDVLFDPLLILLALFIVVRGAFGKKREQQRGALTD